MILAFWQHAKQRYVKNGEPTSEIRSFRTALRPVQQLYGREPVTAFGPLALIACRQKLIESGICRKRINQHVGRIRQAFEWGVSRELVTETVWRALLAVERLKMGEALETEPVRPVSDERITAIEPFVTPQIWAMYRPDFPDRFISFEHALEFCHHFFHWQNHRHHHWGLGLLTPATVHFGQADSVLAARQAVLTAAHAAHPERFVRKPPQPLPLPHEVWINPPADRPEPRVLQLPLDTNSVPQLSQSP